MTVNIEIIAAAVGSLTVISGAVAATYKAVMRRLDRHLDAKLAPLTKWTQNQQTDINIGAERDALLIEAQLVSLEAIHEHKINGNVTGAIGKLREYMLKNSSKPSSYVNE